MYMNPQDALKTAEDLLKVAEQNLEDTRGTGNFFDGLNAIASGLSTEGLGPANAALVHGFQIMPKKAEERREKREQEAEEAVKRAQDRYDSELAEQRKRRADIFEKRLEHYAGVMDIGAMEEALLGLGDSPSAAIMRGIDQSQRIAVPLPDKSSTRRGSKLDPKRGSKLKTTNRDPYFFVQGSKL